MHNILIYLYKDKINYKKSIIYMKQDTRQKTMYNLQLQKNQLVNDVMHTFPRRIFNALPDMYKIYIHVLNSIGLVKKIFRNYILNLNRECVHMLIEKWNIVCIGFTFFFFPFHIFKFSFLLWFF